MKDLKQFNIPFVGLSEGNHDFTFKIENEFFEFFNFDEFKSVDIDVTLSFLKKTTLLELVFKAKGTVEVPCDVTTEMYHQKIKAKLPLVVKFGPEYNEDNEEILILSYDAYQLNVAQYIYELIVLAVPNKKVHPGVLDGTMESETLKKLKELEIKEENTAEEVDPRWDKLKNLLTEKKR
ncbi:MAG: DUF177 domain-containing protein [Polaribacter sp.]|jgi:uncharacterized metal-binding protein YceD (DUF177 family)|nr:DUF177 domain-containing protein [Polaribacter sp.]